MSKKFAVFDIDGTIGRWQFYHAMGDAFTEHGFITPEEYEPVRQARMVWKKRTHQDSFRAYELKLVDAWMNALQRITPEQFNSVAQEVFEAYKDQTYTYTRDLVRELKANGYLLLVISGSPIEIVELFAKYYGFDDFVGTIHHIENGKFTGTATVNAHNKQRILHELIKKHDVTLAGSIGVGDSSGDIEMLDAVEQPIAFNPDQKLYQHARERGWQIVVERKNVVYELGESDGQYILA